MRNFTRVADVKNPLEMALSALELKKSPYSHKNLGREKSLGLVFLNPSLRTRMSTQVASEHLGLHCMVLNIDREGWSLETRDQGRMDGHSVEHIREAASVMGQYCDIIGLRAFAELKSCEVDYQEAILNGFIRYCGVPVISLESALRHPLQSLADLMTVIDHCPHDFVPDSITQKPKITLLWAPHVKALPQAVANSFSEWMLAAGCPLTVGAPEGFELDSQFTAGARVVHSKSEAIGEADFIYVKNWSSFNAYGETSPGMNSWMLTLEEVKKLKPDIKIMHCLPVRRNLELDASILDSPYSLVTAQAKNRIFAAQQVLKMILDELASIP